MIDHVWTVVCSRAVIDQQSNNMSLQNVLERVTVSAEPAPGATIPIRMQAATLWVRSDPDAPAQGRSRVRLVAPSGREYGSYETVVNLSETEGFRSLVRFQGLPTEEVGRHNIIVELQEDVDDKWHQVAAVPLMLLFKPPEDESESEGEEDE